MLKEAKRTNLDRSAQETADRIIEGCRRGAHRCKVCGRTLIPLRPGSEEWMQKVKALVASKVGHNVQEGLVDIHGYCGECRTQPGKRRSRRRGWRGGAQFRDDRRGRRVVENTAAGLLDEELKEAMW